ncbi:MAG: FMN-binding protein [Acidimicrobiales bacterium]
MRNAPKKRHAARKTRAAALTVSVLATGGLAGAMATSNAASDLTSEVATVTTTPPSTPIPSADGSAATPAPLQPEATSNATYADGTFVGRAASTRWGDVQVSVTTSNDQIVAVDLLSIPSADRKSVRINTAAGPVLVSESLTAQSANVDIVSGATYTSKAYRDSLQAALDDASVALSAQLAAT